MYTATVLNYKGVPVTKPDVHVAWAIIEFDTSEGTRIKASCLNTADHKSTITDTQNVKHEVEVPGNKCSQVSEHVGEVFSVVPFTPESYIAHLNAESERHAKEVDKLSTKEVALG